MNQLWAFLDADLARRKLQGASRLALEGYRTPVRQFLRWLEQTRQVTTPAQLQPDHIEQWMLALRNRRTREGLPIKLVTIIGKRRVVKAFCRQLIREGRISRLMLDAFPSIRQPLLLPKPTPVHAQVRKFLRGLPTDTPRRYMLRAIAELLYTSGIRPCELLALDVADVDLTRGMARVMGKGQKERMVPVGRTAVRFLETYIQAIRPLLLRDPAEHALWLNTHGRRLTYHALLFGLHRPLPDQPTRRVTCYTFRRACATELIRSDASVWAVKELLGHEDLDKLQHYVQLNIDDLKKTHARCHPRDML